jgi:hypothetical protein
MFVATGTPSLIRTSTDGITWATPRNPAGDRNTSALGGIAYGAGKWVVVGVLSNQGVIFTSTDGATWTQQVCPTTQGLSDVFFNGTYFLGTGGNGTIIYSYDGINWILSSVGTSVGTGAIGFNGTTWIVQGGQNFYSNPNPISSSTLTIAGCQTDGFAVGNSVVSEPGAAASGTITAVDNTSVTVAPSDTDWAIGQNLKRNPASYTALTGSPYSGTVQVGLADPEVLVPQADLTVSSTYYARVQYATTNTGAATSDFSAWSSFATAAAFAPAPGTAMGGGYFGGQINAGGTVYNLIVAPRATGQFGGNTPSTIQWKTSASADTNPNSQNAVYGKLATDQFTGPTYPAFNWAKGLNIGGNTDWYIPAKNELEILYFNLKPDTTANNTSSGINPNAVPARASNYTAGNPAQTTNALFQSGGSEAFSTAVFYWSSSENSIFTSDAWSQNFSNGIQGGNTKDNLGYARAVRRIAA